MIEELLKTFVGVVDAQLFETIVLERRDIDVPKSDRTKEKSTDIEDLEASDIEHSDEVLSFGFDVQCDIDTFDQPAKHTMVDLSKGQPRLLTRAMIDSSKWISLHLPISTEHQLNWSLDPCSDLCSHTRYRPKEGEKPMHHASRTQRLRTLIRGLSKPLINSAASTSRRWATFSQSSVVSASACSSRGRCFHWLLPKCIIAAVHLYMLFFSS